jgi:hypothetical protein
MEILNICENVENLHKMVEGRGNIYK